eukprot:gnl/MRDRNA2_/MRDRNA2_135857_c0_seq1.p1 gnl/MRDRNA2_/MRDRNA2_135857_c0~~gnl/MRDRNA2_/MRDRNA2_135857_c0_seq1.p1  ORF type:complete len:604 (-),score=110.59 gnl/MRDRNA2_/MRDRNA2_135857_c0_seq1:73-1851(-)
MTPRYRWPASFQGCVFRAQFSSLAPQDLIRAMGSLTVPDEKQSRAVEARQEIDLRVGISFSRFQTQYFRKHFGQQLGKAMVTYGPCQTPTLWFCVKRHIDIEQFVPLPYWQLQATVQLPNGVKFEANLARGSIWQKEDAQQLHQSLEDERQGRVMKKEEWRSSCARPLPLNTVALLRMASDELGIGPGDALHLAEQLYLKGFTSYPRTETDKYPDNFDLNGTIEAIARADVPWSSTAQHLLKNGFVRPRQDGSDAGDHPPITPVKMATKSQCGGDAGWLMYQAICCNFLASISPDAQVRNARVTLQIGSDIFQATSSRIDSMGWLDIENRNVAEEGNVDLTMAHDLEHGFEVVVDKISISKHHTKPPGHLTESELLGLMEEHGIGTDASMASHVSNVVRRKYVDLNEGTRQMVPTALGQALVHALTLIDQELVLPTVRASIENACTRIAKGQADHGTVVSHSLRIFEKKFVKYCCMVDRLPMMLAIALSRDKSVEAVGSAGQAQEMWRKSCEEIGKMSLEALMHMKEDVDLGTASGWSRDDIGKAPQPTDLTHSVVQAQKTLEELGFGSAEPSPASDEERVAARNKKRSKRR